MSANKESLINGIMRSGSSLQWNIYNIGFLYIILCIQAGTCDVRVYIIIIYSYIVYINWAFANNIRYKQTSIEYK